MPQLDSSRPAVRSCHLLLLLHVRWTQSLIVFIYVRAVASMYRYICFQACFCVCVSDHCVRRHDSVALSERDCLTRVTNRSSHFKRGCFKLALIILAACSVSSTRFSLEESSRQAFLVHAANCSISDDLGVLWKSYSLTRRARLATVTAESRSSKKPPNIYVHAHRKTWRNRL